MAADDAEETILRKEYAERCHLYEGFCREAVRQLDELLQQEQIALAFPIEHRVKTLESIPQQEKIEVTERRQIAYLHPRCRGNTHHSPVQAGY